jgi:hypothetical protein
MASSQQNRYFQGNEPSTAGQTIAKSIATALWLSQQNFTLRSLFVAPIPTYTAIAIEMIL